MRKNRYLHPGDSVPEGKPKKHIRKDDGRVILYWDLAEERVFLQAFDSLGNFRIVDGIVQAPKKFFTCAVCKSERSPDQVCPTCRAKYSVDGQLPVWILELVKIQDKAIQNGYLVQSLDAFPTGPPLKVSRWPLNHSRAFAEATSLIEQAQREAELNSSFCSGLKLSEYRRIGWSSQSPSSFRDGMDISMPKSHWKELYAEELQRFPRIAELLSDGDRLLDIAGLTRDEREAWKLKGQLSEAEIASVLKRQKKTVQELIKRAEFKLKGLRDILKGD